MKYIIKTNEPQELLDWKEENKNLNPKFNNLSKKAKDAIFETLLNEQGYICCYCEKELIDKNYHIEHFNPQNKNEIDSLDYSNMLCSCQRNQPKGTPSHCGNSKDGWYVENLLVSPMTSDCEEKFIYTKNGQILPKDKKDEAAKATIKKLQLDIDKLNELRKKAIEPFIEAETNFSKTELNKFIKGYLDDKSKNNGKFNEFFTTIKYLYDN